MAVLEYGDRRTPAVAGHANPARYARQRDLPNGLELVVEDRRVVCGKRRVLGAEADATIAGKVDRLARQRGQIAWTVRRRERRDADATPRLARDEAPEQHERPCGRSGQQRDRRAVERTSSLTFAQQRAGDGEAHGHDRERADRREYPGACAPLAKRSLGLNARVHRSLTRPVAQAAAERTPD